jgi:hypothetical protein
MDSTWRHSLQEFGIREGMMDDDGFWILRKKKFMGVEISGKKNQAMEKA